MVSRSVGELLELVDSLRTEIGRLRSLPSGEVDPAASAAAFYEPASRAQTGPEAFAAVAETKRAKLAELVELAMETGGAVVRRVVLKMWRHHESDMGAGHCFMCVCLSRTCALSPPHPAQDVYWLHIAPHIPTIG